MNKEIKIRGIAAVIFTAISIAAVIILFFCFLVSGESFLDSLSGAAILGFVLGSMGIGFSHLPSVHRRISKLLYIPVPGWGIYLVLILAIPYFGGTIFMLADLIKYLKARKEM